MVRYPTEEEVTERKRIRTEIQNKTLEQAIRENEISFQERLKRRSKEEKKLRNYKRITKLLLALEDMSETGEFLTLGLQRIKEQEDNLTFTKSEISRIWNERHQIKQIKSQGLKTQSKLFESRPRL